MHVGINSYINFLLLYTAGGNSTGKIHYILGNKLIHFTAFLYKVNFLIQETYEVTQFIRKLGLHMFYYHILYQKI